MPLVAQIGDEFLTRKANFLGYPAGTCLVVFRHDAYGDAYFLSGPKDRIFRIEGYELHKELMPVPSIREETIEKTRQGLLNLYRRAEALELKRRL